MSREGSGRGWAWLPTIVAAVIGAAATIVAVLIANGAGAINIAVAGAESTPTVTVTPRPAPTVTVTAPAGGGGGGRTAQGGQTRSLTVPLSQGGSTGVDLDKGQVLLNNNGDLNYQTSEAGSPELVGYLAHAYSVGVSSASIDKQGCMTATTTDPDAEPIVNFHKGLLFCVATGDGAVALVEVTAGLGGSKTLHLHEVYWPNLNQ